MLKEIIIKDFAIVDAATVELGTGMTVITGETGAGKSIMLDALGLCVGDRADTRTVRPGAKKADISASFDLRDTPAAAQWLQARALDTEDGDCLLRRVVSADGRSKAFINGSPATLSDCAALGQLLVDIHSQHAHQSLLRSATQRQLLDAYAGAEPLADAVKVIATNHKGLAHDYARITGQSDADNARRDLLAYQVSELDEIAIGDGEFSELEMEYKALSNADFLLDSSRQAIEGCEVAQDRIRLLKKLIDDDRHDERRVGNLRDLLTSATIQIEEAEQELRHYSDGLDLDPQRLNVVESRLDTMNKLAKKHRVLPEALPEHHLVLSEELAALSGGEALLADLQQQLDQLRRDYQTAAAKLSKARKQAAKKLATNVVTILSQLGMERCQFSVQFPSIPGNELSTRGSEDVAFSISTNPGSDAGPLAKIASGGELSRISLALQVAASESVTVPTMIFDEVDVGIGGGVAEVVGTLLRKLAQSVQVICVTHLGQVAAQGQQHVKVSKGSSDKATAIELQQLTADSRIDEIARMVGGIDVTDSSLAHAKDMLERVDGH